MLTIIQWKNHNVGYCVTMGALEI